MALRRKYKSSLSFNPWYTAFLDFHITKRKILFLQLLIKHLWNIQKGVNLITTIAKIYSVKIKIECFGCFCSFGQDGCHWFLLKQNSGVYNWGQDPGDFLG